MREPSAEPGTTWWARLPYPLVCTLLGLVLGWVPRFLHGPIPEKFNVLYIRGVIAVWAFYSARLLIGFMLGITRWPERWYLRGPLVGFLMMLPVTFVALATLVAEAGSTLNSSTPFRRPTRSPVRELTSHFPSLDDENSRCSGIVSPMYQDDLPSGNRTRNWTSAGLLDGAAVHSSRNESWAQATAVAFSSRRHATVGRWSGCMMAGRNTKSMRHASTAFHGQPSTPSLSGHGMPRL